MKTTTRTSFAALALASIPATAQAHVGLHAHNGFADGFMHPVGGLDHVAAMVAVGLYAAFLGGRSTWALPAAFVGMMTVGAVFGFSGVELPYVEQAIGLSVVALGSLVALGVKMPTGLAMSIVGLFAVFHGQAHGAELPANAAPFGFAAGFLLATAALHLAGVAFGMGLFRLGDDSRTWANRAIGGGLTALGVVLVA